MDFLKRIRNILKTDKNMVEEVSSEIIEENLNTVSTVSLFATVVLFIMMIISLFTESIYDNFPVYITFFIVELLFFMCSRIKMAGKIERILVNSFIFSVLFFGVILGTVFSPDELTVCYVALMFAIPMAFITERFSADGVIALSIVIYIVIAEFTQTKELLLYNLINVLIFGILSMLISTFVTNVRIQRMYFLKMNVAMEQLEKEKIEEAASIDKLTGCKNRNALTWVYNHEYEDDKPIAIVLCDLNGLKQINDLSGHVAGDKFIIRIAGFMKKIFGKDNVYRIGGDEFIAVLIGKDTAGLDSKCIEMKKEAGDSISFGAATGNTSNLVFDDLLSAADKKMYVEKQLYYAEHPEKKDGRQAVMEYKDIISSAGLGIWHILLKDGVEPRMQANEKMLELLGIRDSIGMTEEDIYNAWYSRITPKAIPSVNASVQEMIDGKFSENTYQWKHPEKGIIYVRCGGTAITLSDGTKMLRGYHGDVTDIVTNEQKHKKALEEMGAMQKEALDVFNTIHDAMGSANWHMTFNEEGNMISCEWSDRFRQLLGFKSQTDFPNRLETWSDRLHPEDREAVLREYWDTVGDVSGTKTFNVKYRMETKNNGYGWYRAFGTLTRRSDGTPKIFYGLFMEVDD